MSVYLCLAYPIFTPWVGLCTIGLAFPGLKEKCLLCYANCFLNSVPVCPISLSVLANLSIYAMGWSVFYWLDNS